MQTDVKKKYSLLVFDWDGTLVNSENLAVKTIQDIAKKFDYPIPNSESIHRCFGMSLDKIHQKLFPGHDKNYHAFNQKFYANFTEEKLANSFFEGAVETLKYLKTSGFTLAIATNKPEEKLEAALKFSGIKELFSSTRSPENYPPKPNPDMLLTLLKELNFNKHETLMIGDSAFDMQFAANAEVDALAACYTKDKKQLLSKFHPVAFIENITELKDIFSNKNNA